MRAYNFDPMTKGTYTNPGRLGDVLALIQVLAFDPDSPRRYCALFHRSLFPIKSEWQAKRRAICAITSVASKDSSIHRYGLRFFLVLFLHLLQFAPALILLGFDEISIFVVL